jgi:apolipoprotein N-acyltransferase
MARLCAKITKLGLVGEVLLASLTGILVCISLTQLWGITFFCLTPLMFSLRNGKYPYFACFSGGLACYMPTLWGIHSYNLVGFVFAISYGALTWTLWLWFSRGLRFRGSRPVSHVGIASVWTSLEFLRLYAFDGNAWCLLGSGLHHSYFCRVIAGYTGLPSLSLIVMLVNFASYRFMRVGSWKKFTCLNVILIALCSIERKFDDLNEHRLGEIAFACVQPSTQSNGKEWRSPLALSSNQTELRMITKNLLNRTSPPQLIIWPESSIYISKTLEEIFNVEPISLIGKVVPQMFIFGCEWKKGPNEASTTIGVLRQSDNSHVLMHRSKFSLVPFGEYVPNWAPKFVHKVFHDTHKYTTLRGESPRAFIFNDTSFAVIPLICYEDGFYRQIKFDYQSSVPKILVCVGNDSDFLNTSIPKLHLTQAQWTCAQLGLPMIRCFRGGETCHIDETGRLLHALELISFGSLCGAVVPVAKLSFYAKFASFINLFFILLPLLLHWLSASFNPPPTAAFTPTATDSGPCTFDPVKLLKKITLACALSLPASCLKLENTL